MATRGLDLTDEGFYLNTISHPADDRSTMLLFGYVYHPLYVLAGGDVVLLRWIGMGLSFLAVASLAWVVLGTPALTGNRRLPRLLRAGASAGLGATTLATVAQMPMTPGYNALALQGLAVAMTGLVVVGTRDGTPRSLGAALLGVGGWLTFMGKPTTAAALSAIVVGCILALPGPSRRSLWIAPLATCASAGITLIMYGLSPSELARVLSAGFATSQALGGHDSLVRRDPFLGQPLTLVLLLLAVAVALGAVYVATRATRLSPKSWRRHLGEGFAFLTLMAGLGVIAYSLVWRWEQRPASTPLAATDAASNLLLATATGIGAVAVVTWSLFSRDRTRTGLVPLLGRIDRLQVTTVGALLCMPPAYAFGTNVNLWAAQGRAACFWLLALGVLLVRFFGTGRLRLVWVAPTIAATTLLIATLVTAAAAPYRYAPLSTATIETRVGGGTIRLTGEDHQAVTALGALAQRLHIDEQTRVLDLTGDSPGSIFILGARAVGQGWIIGGYRGSEPAARLAIENDRCSVRNALLLVSPSAPRAVSVRVLAAAGLALERDYEPAGEFPRVRASSAGARLAETVMVYRPRKTGPPQQCSQ